jgi:hypothetical protein
MLCYVDMHPRRYQIVLLMETMSIKGTSFLRTGVYLCEGKMLVYSVWKGPDIVNLPPSDLLISNGNHDLLVA